MDDSPFEGEPLIYGYTRRQALDDGVLVDLTDQAQETGFVFPVACTGTLFHRYLVPDETLEAQGQSLDGRLHDLLTTLYAAIQQAPPRSNRLAFTTRFLMPSGKHASPTLISVCGPDDAGDPVITIMLPGED